MSPMGALWQWQLRALVAHVLLFVALLVTAVVGNDSSATALFGVDRYLGGSVLYLVLLLPLVLVLGLALRVVAGERCGCGARPLVAATVVGVAATALRAGRPVLVRRWDRIPR